MGLFTTLRSNVAIGYKKALPALQASSQFYYDHPRASLGLAAAKVGAFGYGATTGYEGARDRGHGKPYSVGAGVLRGEGMAMAVGGAAIIGGAMASPAGRAFARNTAMEGIGEVSGMLGRYGRAKGPRQALWGAGKMLGKLASRI